MGRHRAEVRPRYGRISVLGSSLVVLLIAVLGGTGLLPRPVEPSAGAAQPTPAAPAQPDLASGALAAAPAAVPGDAATPVDPVAAGRAVRAAILADTSLPSRSGSGYRVVFSEGRQRVWLVEEDGRVASTYLASGSVYDNLEPGTFEVYSRSEDATGIEGSGTMKYFVRFTQGDTGAAIGFHDIPVLGGKRVQRYDELGTPLSHGCIRQRRSDAVRLWNFAPLGTTVVVTA